MTQPATKIKNPEMEEYWEKALNSERGIAMTLETPNQAIRRSLELNAFRSSIRKFNASIYPEDHPMHGASRWDKLAVTKDPENPCRILIKEKVVQVVTVEEL